MIEAERTTSNDMLLTTRALFYVATALVLGAGGSLIVFTESTDRFFAWPINPPLTAVFMGSLYWAAAILQLAAARQKQWYLARVGAPGILAFTILTLIATLLHPDPFSFDEPIGLIWISVYALFPIVALVVFALQYRHSQWGVPTPPPATLSPMLQGIGIGLAAIMILVGIAMFVAPLEVARIWPWTLSELTGRTIAAWFVGLGITGVMAVWAADIRHANQVARSMFILVALVTLALIRYRGEIDWNSAEMIGFLVVLGLLFVIAIATFLQTPLENPEQDSHRIQNSP